MRILRLLLSIVAAAALVYSESAGGGRRAAAPRASAQQRDYLTELEADRIRDAESPSEKIKLFIGFAADRLKKFNYENSRTTADRNRNVRLKSLLEAYAGCMDDAAELMNLGRTKQEDIRLGVKYAQEKGKQFQADLQRLAAALADNAELKDNFEEALVATKDALAEADKAAKEISPGPVRRKQ